MRLGYVFLLCAAIYLISVLEPQTATSADDLLLQRAESAAQAIAPAWLSNRMQRGRVVSTDGTVFMDEDELNNRIMAQPRDAARPVLWFDNQRSITTMSAMGVDKRHHFANSYLLGYEPFKTDNSWMPLYILASRKIYQYDHEQYFLDDIWQNSAQAYYQLRGDCEDHAIVLADWLIASGIDARVVVGRYRGEGHAWVVAFSGGQAFLLEATDKRRYRNWNHYPLASLSRDYQPDYMFNRSTFWRNTVAGKSAGYSVNHWQEASFFASNN